MNKHKHEDAGKESEAAHRHPMHWRKKVAVGFGFFIAAWFLFAYVIAPYAWEAYAHEHPALDEMPGLTITGDDHPGDPINVSLIGQDTDLKSQMKAAGWYPADPLGLKSDLKIAADTVLKESYDEAPVSNLFLFGRKEDFAFEQPVGGDPRKRHHVRFWKCAKVDDQGRPAWAGSATYDERVGLSHTTGQITHHISGDVDAERDHLFDTLKKVNALTKTEIVDGFHKVREGKNGGGDAWHTDGRLFVGVLAK